MGFESSKAEFGSKLLVTSNSEPSLNNPYYYMERMRIWKMGNPPVLLHDHTCKFRNLYLVKVDEQFMVLCNFTTLYFISTETLDDVQSFTVLSGNEIRYQRGLFFFNAGALGSFAFWMSRLEPTYAT